MEIIVVSKAMVKKMQYKITEPTAIVSISGVDDNRVSFNNPNVIVGRFIFEDIPYPIEGYTHFTEEDAKDIFQFVDRVKDKVNTIVVHCEAGISRSPTVAYYIADRIGVPKDSIKQSPFYKFNPWIVDVFEKVIKE